jgi:hypothetical protein
MNVDDTAARIMAELAGEAEFIDGGGFTIDPEAARKKLADRQLAEADAWILLVMETAELLGVEQVEIRERPAGLRIRLRGRTATELFSAAELGELFTWVFTELADLDPTQQRRARARQLLALGVNAALARPVRSVALARITPEQSHRVLLRPDAPGVLGAIAPGPHELELRFDANVEVARTTGQAFEPRPELGLVVERCGYGEVAIEIFGRAVPRRPAPAEPRATRNIEFEGEIVGVAEIVANDGWPRVMIVANGVLLESIPLPGWAQGFRALLREGFTRDLSLGRAIRDERFERLSMVVRSIHDQLVAELHARGQLVLAGRSAPAPAHKPPALAAMINDADSSIGHTAIWAALGFGWMTAALVLSQSWIAAGILAAITCSSIAVAVYFLRVRKVFGDER